ETLRRLGAIEELPKVEERGEREATRSDAAGRLRSSPSLESVLLGGGLGGAVTRLLLGVYYYVRFGPTDESVTRMLIAEMLVAGVVMGMMFGFCIHVVILWFHYLVSNKRHSPVLLNEVSGGVVGGALGGIPVGILA